MKIIPTCTCITVDETDVVEDVVCVEVYTKYCGTDKNYLNLNYCPQCGKPYQEVE